MTNISRDMAVTSVTDFFTLQKLGPVHQCLDENGLGPGGN